MESISEPHVYWQKHFNLVRKYITTIPANDFVKLKVTAQNRTNRRNRIKQIFWECDLQTAINMVEKSPVIRDSFPYSNEWNVTFYNNSSSNVDIKLYAFEEDDIGLVDTEN